MDRLLANLAPGERARIDLVGSRMGMIALSDGSDVEIPRRVVFALAHEPIGRSADALRLGRRFDEQWQYIALEELTDDELLAMVEAIEHVGGDPRAAPYAGTPRSEVLPALRRISHDARTLVTRATPEPRLGLGS